MLDPAWTEIGIFVSLVFLSAFLFAYRIRPVLVTIFRSRPDPGFQFAPGIRRVRDFIWEVLLQSKVIRERPLPGLAHAFVFWGFGAFALVTLDHLAAGVGRPFLHANGFGALYSGVAAVFAVAVLVSILGLAFRRFALRPKWLGPLSLESGIIAGLISALMITYLLSLRIPDGTPAGRVNWWIHTAALLVFLPLIPKTKHLHLALSPFAIFFSRGGFSRIPPLTGDEDFGIVTGKDLTNIIALQAFSCVECGRCTQHCPANNTGKILDPKKIALGVRQYLRDHGPNAAEPVVGRYVPEEALFQCTSCGACEYQCPVGIEHVPIIVGLRRGLVNTGTFENEYANKLFLNLERNGNSLGFAASERDKFVQRAGLPVYDGTQEYCLWLGCMGAYDPRGREIIEALAAVMRRLNVTFGVLRREKCSGDPVRRLGNDYLFAEMAQSNLEQIRLSKAAKLISICPHCVRTMTEDWSEAGGAVNMEHHSAFLARHAAELGPLGESGKVVFHDPCYLGRYRDRYEEPRDVARPSVEAPRSRERSFCCGAGGGLAFLGEEKGKRVSVERAEELAATGAGVIAAACPFCNTMFRDALTQISPAAPQLKDIAELAAASLNGRK